MKALKFLIITILVWFPLVFGLGIAAELCKLQDTDLWMWVMRVVAGILAVCVALMAVGVSGAKRISNAVWPLFVTINSIMQLLCVVFGAVAIVMIFVKDYQWLYTHLYHPFLLPLASLILFCFVPIAVIFMICKATRLLGAVGLIVLSYHFGFTFWFYTLMLAGSYGVGWVVGGVICAGIGVVFTSIIASFCNGHWQDGGGLILLAALILGARLISMVVINKESEK